MRVRFSMKKYVSSKIENEQTMNIVTEISSFDYSPESQRIVFEEKSTGFLYFCENIKEKDYDEVANCLLMNGFVELSSHQFGFFQVVDPK